MWPRGRPRQPCSDAARFFASVIAERGIAATSRAAGSDMRTVRRWATGQRRCGYGPIERVADWIAPLGAGWTPIYSPGMAIDGNTRVGGVGDYTLRAARGDRIHGYP